VSNDRPDIDLRSADHAAHGAGRAPRETGSIFNLAARDRGQTVAPRQRGSAPMSVEAVCSAAGLGCARPLPKVVDDRDFRMAELIRPVVLTSTHG
jgi:hypothetical protein